MRCGASKRADSFWESQLWHNFYPCWAQFGQGRGPSEPQCRVLGVQLPVLPGFGAGYHKTWVVGLVPVKLVCELRGPRYGPISVFSCFQAKLRRGFRDIWSA